MIASIIRPLVTASLAFLSAGTLAGALTIPNTTEAEAPMVELEYATYKGTTLQNGVNQFLGIRYAEPPTGGLRWREPQDPVPESGEVTAATDVSLSDSLPQSEK